MISDALNHASIIDGIRLSKARRLRYDNNDMAQLEQRLQEAADARYRLIATDGVFSMDGVIADLAAICDLADRYDAMVMVDDSHAVGFVGPGGRGTPEHCGVMDRVDIVTGTLGKAMGGASGGYTSGRREIIDWLRQRSRPYLFSNSLAPAIAATTLQVLELLQSAPDLQQQLERNSQRFRDGDGGGRIHAHRCRPSDHPGHARRCTRGRRDGGSPARRGRLRDRLLVSRSCRRTGRASARRCRPRTPTTTSPWPSTRSPGSVARCGVVP